MTPPHTPPVATPLSLRQHSTLLTSSESEIEVKILDYTIHYAIAKATIVRVSMCPNFLAQEIELASIIGLWKHNIAIVKCILAVEQGHIDHI